MLEDIRLGQLGIAAGLLDEEDLDAGLAEQREAEAAGRYSPIGQVLVKRGSLTRSQLRRLLRQQKTLAAKVTRIGKYQLLALRAEGGMGAVYKAQDVEKGLTVALKVLPRSHARKANLLERFRREALSGSFLDHPNIVRVFDADYADGYHFIAMEYVQGMSTAEMLAESGRLKERDALSIIIQVTRALEHISDHGLVHRDIKPGNILVDSEGVAKLADMGLALWVERPMPRLTLTGRMMGTPFYISPEQARGETDLDIRSDIYSLGTTLYEFVTGLPPFRGKTAADVLARHLTEAIPSPQEIERTLSDGVCNVIAKMMAKERKNRYQTARELMKDLLVVYRGEDPQRLRTEKPAVKKNALPPPITAVEPLPGETLPRDRPTPLSYPRAERRFQTATRTAVSKPVGKTWPVYYYLAPFAAVSFIMLGVAVGVNLSGTRETSVTTNFVFANNPLGALGWRGGNVGEFLGRNALVAAAGSKLQFSTVAWQTGDAFGCGISASSESETDLLVWLQGQNGILYLSIASIGGEAYRELNLSRSSFSRWPDGAEGLPVGTYYNMTLEVNPEMSFAVESINLTGTRPVLVTLSQ
jgi:serine/threonine-protein kinase